MVFITATETQTRADSFQLLTSEPLPVPGKLESKHAEGINCIHLGIAPTAVSLLTGGERQGGDLNFFL